MFLVVLDIWDSIRIGFQCTGSRVDFLGKKIMYIYFDANRFRIAGQDHNKTVVAKEKVKKNVALGRYCGVVLNMPTHSLK